MGKKFVPQTEPLSNEEIQEQTRFRIEKLNALKTAGKDPYEELTYDVTGHSVDIIADYDRLAGSIVRVAGRLMSKRGMGKVSFCDLYDRRGKIQIFTKVDVLGEEAYANWQNLDIGDVVGVEGEVYLTEKGEVSIVTHSYTLLAKCLHPLPNKYQGLKDTEIRYRQRYLDLIVNPQVKDTFEKRSRIIKEIRNFLDGRDFMEVETPLLVSNAGGASARPFETHFNALDIDLKLRISLELYLKRLIVGGFERVYEIGRVFRNEGMDTRHNPEFTLMELYQAYTDYQGMMELTESMFRYVAEKVCGTTLIKYGDLELDFGKPFARLTMNDAIRQYAGIDFDSVTTDEEARALADEHHLEYEKWHKKGDIINLFFEEYCEKNLLQPTFIMDHPLAISPLTKKKKDEPEKVERFELFINTWEMCNAYSELNDPIDQRERVKAQDAAADAGDEEANKDVLLFPTMKPLNDVKSSNDVKTEAVAAPVEAVAEAKSEPEIIDFSKVKVEPMFEEMVDFETFSKSDFRAVKVLACEAVKKSKKLLQFTLDDGTGTNRTILSGIHAYYEPEELVGKTLIAITNLTPRAMMGIDSCGMLLSAIHDEEGEEKLHLLMVDNHIPAGAKLY